MLTPPWRHGLPGVMKHYINSLLALALLGSVGCGSDEDDGEENELITTIKLRLTPAGGGTALEGVWSDVDGDGGGAPVITAPAALTNGTSYDAALEISNESVSPAEDITAEIKAEAEEHLFAFSGTAIEGGKIAVDIADKESDYTMNAAGDDLPVGLKSTVRALAVGTGALRIRLAHLPPVNDMLVKKASTNVDGQSIDFDISLEIRVE